MLLGNTPVLVFNQVVQGAVISLLPSAQNHWRHLPKGEAMIRVCGFAILLSWLLLLRNTNATGRQFSSLQ